MSDVVIIGAVIAGIKAAEVIKKKAPGLDVTILKSRKAIGGRAISSKAMGSYTLPM